MTLSEPLLGSSVAQLESQTSTRLEYSTESSRPVKRPRLTGGMLLVGQDLDIGSEEGDVLVSHPLGVRPEGNAYADHSGADLRANAGLFRQLPDELLSYFLEYLAPTDLVSVGSTCRVLYAFTRVDDLWKSIFVE
jgi:hypothetical protein